MVAVYSPCNLCEGSNRNRVSPNLSNLYVRIMALTENEREKEINSLLEKRPCAVAKIAALYLNSQFAYAFSKRFSEEVNKLDYCQFRGSDPSFSSVSLCELAGAVSFLTDENNTSEKVSRVGINSIDKIIGEKTISYDPFSNQGVFLQDLSRSFLSEDTSSIGLRIVEGIR